LDRDLIVCSSVVGDDQVAGTVERDEETVTGQSDVISIAADVRNRCASARAEEVGDLCTFGESLECSRDGVAGSVIVDDDEFVTCERDKGSNDACRQMVVCKLKRNFWDAIGVGCWRVFEKMTCALTFYWERSPEDGTSFDDRRSRSNC